MGNFNSGLMWTALNVSAITSIIDSGGLFDGRVIDQKFEGLKTINFYLSGPYNGALEWNEYNYSVDCRAGTDAESRAIAEAVFDQLNRADFTDYHTNASVLGTLPPADETDVFNTPVQIILKSRI